VTSIPAALAVWAIARRGVLFAYVMHDTDGAQLYGIVIIDITG
jgi:hypothetical protein